MQNYISEFTKQCESKESPYEIYESSYVINYLYVKSAPHLFCKILSYHCSGMLFLITLLILLVTIAILHT